MDVGIRMRILIWVGVLNHAAERLRFQHDPRAFSFLKVVSDLHAGAGRPTRLWSKLNFRMSLVPVDRKAANIHVHGAHIQRDRKSTRLNSSHVAISYAVFCLTKKQWR